MTTPESAATRVSPRTPARPMAFTGSEFGYGAWRAWLWFQCAGPVLVFLWLLIAGPHAVNETMPDDNRIGFALESTLLAGILGLPISSAALVVGALPAYFLGKALQRVRDEQIHIVVFAVFGLAIGAVTFLVFTDPTARWTSPTSGLWIVLVLAAGVVVPLGQCQAAGRALRVDARPHKTIAPLSTGTKEA